MGDGGASVHPQGGAEGGAKVAVCEGNSRCTQPKDRALILSPRYQMKEPRVNPWVLSFGGGESSGFGRRFAERRSDDSCPR